MKQYIVDAFTSTPFTGNPAAICVMDHWPSEENMKKLARENNLSETAFIVKEKQGYHLRWFTPTTEVEICGHATLASSFVVLNYYEKGSNQVTFKTMSGDLVVHKNEDLYEMTFPIFEMKEIEVSDKMEKAFGIRPLKAMLGLDLVLEFENEEIVRNMKPDYALLEEIEGRIQNATAKGKDYDFVSRSFAPKLGIPEDPVCGSAHVAIAPYWKTRLHQNHFHALQASLRTGELDLTILDETSIVIAGKACLVGIMEFAFEL